MSDNEFVKVKITNKSLGSYSGREFLITPELQKQLEAEKSKIAGNMYEALKMGRALQGFKHLVEMTSKYVGLQLALTHKPTSSDSQYLYICFNDYRDSGKGVFFSLYRQTGLDVAKKFLVRYFPDKIPANINTEINPTQLKKVEKDLPNVLSKLSVKAKNKKILIEKTTEIVSELNQKKNLLAAEVEQLEEIRQKSNIAVFMQRLDNLRVRLTKKYPETNGKNSWQSWIYQNNWLLGINYQKPIQKTKVGFENIPDYLFPTLDGFLDILEIKLPTHEAIIIDNSHPGAYKWSDKTSEAIGQVVNYLSEIDLHQLELKQKINRAYGKMYEVNILTIKPRAFILVGRSIEWDEEKKEAFRKLNYALHGIEVLTYDDLIVRANQIINMYSKNLE